VRLPRLLPFGRRRERPAELPEEGLSEADVQRLQNVQRAAPKAVKVLPRRKRAD
jgi:hypothetical protein